MNDEEYEERRSEWRAEKDRHWDSHSEAFGLLHDQIRAEYDAISVRHDATTCRRCRRSGDVDIVTATTIVEVKPVRAEPKWTRRMKPSRSTP